MSMILAAEEAAKFPALSETMVALGALALAALMGFFSPRRIVGPSRISEDESPRLIVGIIGVALMAWAGTSVLLQRALGIRRGPDGKISYTDVQQVLFNGGLELGVFVAILIASWIVRTERLRRVGLEPRRMLRGLFAGFVGVVIILPILLYASAWNDMFWERLHKTHGAHDMLVILGKTPSHWLAAATVVSAVIIAPLAEEMFFRGLIQTAVRYSIPLAAPSASWIAVIFSAASFAALHDWWEQPLIFILGVALGYVYERTGNLWSSVFLHALFNLTSITLYLNPYNIAHG